MINIIEIKLRDNQQENTVNREYKVTVVCSNGVVLEWEKDRRWELTVELKEFEKIFEGDSLKECFDEAEEFFSFK